jgi:hypothetical protein
VTTDDAESALACEGCSPISTSTIRAPDRPHLCPWRC